MGIGEGGVSCKRGKRKVVRREWEEENVKRGERCMEWGEVGCRRNYIFFLFDKSN